MSAKIGIRHVEGTTVLEVSGRITLGEGGVTLRDAIQDTLKTGTTKLIVDMGGVNYMDSSGLGALVGLYVSATKQHCELKLIHLNHRVKELFRITKLASVFEGHEELSGVTPD